MKNKTWISLALQVLTAISTIPRWITALSPADRSGMEFTSTPLWSQVTIGSAVMFAIVESFAASYIMSSSKVAQQGSRTQKFVWFLYVVILVMLAMTMGPVVVVNTTGQEISDLGTFWVIVYAISVAGAPFVVLGGVGYADVVHNGRPPALPKSTSVVVETASKWPQSCVLCDYSIKSPSDKANHMRWKHPRITSDTPIPSVGKSVAFASEAPKAPETKE
jgi:hypothetical protein